MEPGPSSYVALRQNRPNTASINAAVCTASSTVHFVEKPGVGGIVEFMTDIHKGQYFTASELAEGTAIPCIPMQAIFDHLHLTHIDFFSLDVEGAELNLLRTIDFRRMSFDVIVMEADRSDLQHEADITALLATVGYHALHQRGIFNILIFDLFYQMAV